MDWLTEAEECLLINARELSQLWAVLADWTKSEDEDLWPAHTPRFARIIEDWDRRDVLEVWRGPSWPAHERGARVAGDELARLLAEPATWRYEETPAVVFGLLPGPRFAEVSNPPAG